MVRNVLENTSKKEFSSKWLRKVRNYYKLCTSRDDEPLRKTRHFIHGLIKQIPINLSKNYEENKTSLAKMLADIFNNYGISTFLYAHIGINDKNSTEHILKLDQPSFTFPHKENYDQQNQTQAQMNKKYLIDYMKTIFKLVQNEYPKTSKLESIINLEYELSSAELNIR